MLWKLNAVAPLALAALTAAALAGCNGQDIPTPTTVPLDSQTPVPLPDLLILPEALDFEEVPVGERASLTLELKNVGEALLNISAVYPENQGYAEVFRISPEPPFELGTGGATLSLEVEFVPQQATTYSDFIVVESTDPENPHKVPVNGVGTGTGTVVPETDAPATSSPEPTAPPEGSPTDGSPTNGSPTDGSPTDGSPTDGSPTDGSPTEGEDTTSGTPGKIDNDGDGFSPGEGAFADCDDNNPQVYPGASDTPDDGVDQDCSGSDALDEDNDGVASEESGGSDCDDADPASYPGAPEQPYDGVDQDCDGADITDADADGYNSDQVGGADCNDGDADFHPGAIDIPYDGLDQDCTGEDEIDVDNDGFIAVEVFGDDCDDEDANTYPNAQEFGDGEDNDCDGSVDEGLDTTDDDGDGYSEEQGDCNDDNDEVYPGAVEIPYDRVDQDCDGSDLDDLDEDGYPSSVVGGGDCDDTAADIHPDAQEVCDGVDQNCVGGVDEGVQSTFYQDGDADSYGDPAASTQACAAPSGYVANQTDCDDDQPSTFPGAPERCDGADNDCDGATDEGVTSTFYADDDGDGFGDAQSPTSACNPAAGYVADNTDCDDTSAATSPGATERCDGKDNDCDGQVDEGTLSTFYRDGDGDTYGNAASTTQACSAPSGYVADKTDCNDANANVNPGATEVPYNGLDDDCSGGDMVDADADGHNATQASGDDCDDTSATTYPGATEIDDDKDNDCDGQVDEGLGTTDDDKDGYSEAQGDCNDNDPAVKPGATETCDAKDNNCDGQIDEGVKKTWYRDADADSYGASASSQQACAAPSGYVSDGTDCNDNDAAIHPGATEICNSKDDNCDTVVDEGVRTLYYRDADGDGYGVSSLVVESCTAPSGYALIAGDCDDTRASVNPGATETCDALDNDCDGTADDGVAVTYYRDADGDGFGGSTSTSACSAPPGYVAATGDCDDTRAAVYPGATEICDTLDNDCDSSIDEGVTRTYYKDNDRDGFGQTSSTLQACSLPGGYAAVGGDCNDSAATVYPGAPEKCNNVDDDCDGTRDEGATSTFYQDADGDTYGNPNVSTQGCTAPSGYVVNKTDCDDTNAAIKPSAAEICDGVDNNCDGDIDSYGVVDGDTWYYDGDADGYGTGAVSLTACEQPDGFVSNDVDCDDAYVWGVEEVCDGRDNDCDGDADFVEGYPTTRVGYSPRYVAFGDWNKDGHRDVVTANYSSNTISILSFTGGGTYALRQSLSVGSQPTWVAPSDIDGDGDTDLLVAAYGGQRLTRVVNNGSGGFTVVEQLSLGFKPYGLAVGDFDGDSDPDVAISNESAGGVILYKNSGGVFSAGAQVLTGATPQGLTHGDFDGDGDLDVAVANSGAGTLSILKNNGAGAFTVSSTINAGGNPSRVVSALLNTDSNLDLAVTLTNTHQVALYKGNPAGVFTSLNTLAVGNQPVGIVAADLDGDSDQDLAVTNLDSHTVSVLRNSSGTFSVVGTPGTAHQPFALTAADSDEDGDVDLMVVALSNNSSSGVMQILRNRGGGTFTLPGATNLGAAPYGSVTADFNKDGRMDYALAMYGNHTVTVYLQNSSGGFALGSSTTVQYYPQELAVGDWDQDGDVDLAASTNHDNGRLHVLKNNGAGVMTASWLQGPGRSYGVVAGDWDQDGDLDLAWSIYYASGQDSNQVVPAFNTGGSFTLGAPITVGNYPLGMVSGDLDGDGDDDLAVTNYNSNTISVLRSDGAGGFPDQDVLLVGSGPYNVVSADYDQDGTLDLAVVSRNSGTVSLLMGDGLGGLLPAISTPSGAQSLSLANLDFDSDGLLDLVVTNLGTGTVTFLSNKDDGVFVETGYIGTPGSAYFVTPITTTVGQLYLLVSNLHTSTLTLLTQDCD